VAEAPSSRDKILDVAEALFAPPRVRGIGCARWPTPRVCRSRRCSTIPQQEQLYHEVILRMLLRIRERFDADTASTDSPRAQLERLIEDLIDTFADTRPFRAAPAQPVRGGGGARARGGVCEAQLASILGDADG